MKLSRQGGLTQSLRPTIWSSERCRPWCWKEASRFPATLLSSATTTSTSPAPASSHCRPSESRRPSSGAPPCKRSSKKASLDTNTGTLCSTRNSSSGAFQAQRRTGRHQAPQPYFPPSANPRLGSLPDRFDQSAYSNRFENLSGPYRLRKALQTEVSFDRHRTARRQIKNSMRPAGCSPSRSSLDIVPTSRLAPRSPSDRGLGR